MLKNVKEKGLYRLALMGIKRYDKIHHTNYTAQFNKLYLDNDVEGMKELMHKIEKETKKNE